MRRSPPSDRRTTRRRKSPLQNDFVTRNAIADWHLTDIEEALKGRGWRIVERLPGDDYRISATWQLERGNDLDAILRHYADDIVFHSPRIALVMGEKIDSVAGKRALARYWDKALASAKDLHFTFDRLYIGSDSLTIAYRNHRGQNAAETFVFDTAGLVKESIATYA